MVKEMITKPIEELDKAPISIGGLRDTAKHVGHPPCLQSNLYVQLSSLFLEGLLHFLRDITIYHQKIQVPKMEGSSPISCMDTAYVRENPSPK